MASQRFTIEHSDLSREFGGGKKTFSTFGDIGAVWLDERGETLEEAELEEVVLPPVEWPSEERSINSAVGNRLVVSRSSAPEAARSIRFRRGDGTATFATGSTADRWVAERITLPFGSAQDQYEVRIFSELFTNFDRFAEKVEAFYDALRQVAPFSLIDGAGKLRVVGHYARSTADDGHFRTEAPNTAGERRIYGDRPYAQDRLRTELNEMPALILIDSIVAGGAGGMLRNGRPYWLAWASLGGMGAGAGWQEVAIHELAHGFGLSDEYIDAAMADQRKPERYGNVSDATLAGGLSWNGVAGLPVTTALPTHSNSGAPLAGNEPRSAVAAYQGAFYATDHWRPSLSCRMRNYKPGGFCQVCSRVILDMYGME